MNDLCNNNHVEDRHFVRFDDVIINLSVLWLVAQVLSRNFCDVEFEYESNIIRYILWTKLKISNGICATKMAPNEHLSDEKVPNTQNFGLNPMANCKNEKISICKEKKLIESIETFVSPNSGTCEAVNGIIL